MKQRRIAQIPEIKTIIYRINSIDSQYSSETSENCHWTNLLGELNCSTNDDNSILVSESDHKDLSEIL